jgi:hypothetical protein
MIAQIVSRSVGKNTFSMYYFCEFDHVERYSAGMRDLSLDCVIFRNFGSYDLTIVTTFARA